jgi:prophage regulatory protein
MPPKIDKNTYLKLEFFEKNTYVRLSQIVGSKTTVPPIPAMIPVSASSWWSGVKSGRYPQPIKLSARTTVWKLSDILELMEDLAAKEYKPECGRKAKRCTAEYLAGGVK